MLVFRLLRKHLSLRIVNLVGLSIVLTSLLVSFNHIKREMSWDRYNADADRIVRLTLAVDGQPIDGRLWGNVLDDPVRQLSQVEKIAKLHEVYRPELKYSGKSIMAEEKTCMVNRDFLDMFDIEMLEGELPSALDALDCVIISESMAKRLAAVSGGEVSEDLQIEGEKCRITGVFKDIPETSH